MKDFKIISRVDAKVLGQKHYFTGKPCKHGHVAERFVSTKACIECGNVRSAIWRNDNPEKARRIVRGSYVKWAKKNPDKLKSHRDKYYAKHRDKCSERAARWAEKNPDKVNAKNSKRRSLLRGLAPVITQEEIMRIKIIYASAARRSRVTGKKFHVDHKIPLARGGVHHPDNLQVVCAKYNQTKGAKTDEEMVKVNKAMVF